MAGPPGAPLVVFLPGFMQRGAAWAPVADRVAERYRCLCLDHRTRTWAERLAEVRDAAPPDSVLVGYSMGGRLALHAAVAEPGRYAALVTVGASAGVEDSSSRAARRTADEQLAAWMETASIEEIVAHWEALPIFAGQSEALVAAQRPGRLSHRPASLASLLRSGGQGALEPAWDAVASLAVPLLALAGARDGAYVEAAKRLAAVAPRALARAVPEAGHAAQLERPAEVAEIIGSFLDRLVAPASTT